MGGSNGNGQPPKRKRGRPAGWRGTYTSHKLPKPTVGVPFVPDPAQVFTREQEQRLTAFAAWPDRLVAQAKAGNVTATLTIQTVFKCSLATGVGSGSPRP